MSSVAENLAASFAADGGDSVEEVSAITIVQAGQSEVLRMAWKDFLEYYKNACDAQYMFYGQRWCLLAGGVIVGLLTVLRTSLSHTDWGITLLSYTMIFSVKIDDIFKAAILLLPAVVALIATNVLSANQNTKKDNKPTDPTSTEAQRFEQRWLFLTQRSGANNIRSEIYQYRARSGVYADPATRDQRLAERLQSWERSIWNSGGVSSAIQKPFWHSFWYAILRRLPYTAQFKRQHSLKKLVKKDPAYRNNQQRQELFLTGTVEDQDNPYSDLNQADYIKFRLEPALSYYEQEARSQFRNTQCHHYWVGAIGIIGSLLALTGFDLWVAVTASLAAAIASYTDLRYNIRLALHQEDTALQLKAILSRWKAKNPCPPAEYNKFVQEVETIIRKAIGVELQVGQQEPDSPVQPEPVQEGKQALPAASHS